MITDIIRKIKKRLITYYNRTIFKKYGANVTILKPSMITNPKYIEIGSNVLIREYSRIEAVDTYGNAKYTPELKIGDGTHIEQFFHVGSCECVEIGKNVLIAGRVYISDHNHNFKNIEEPIVNQGIEAGGKVVIGDNSWLGEGCVILPGVSIGKGAVIGSNAVVTKSIPPFSVAVGIPAKVIRQYNNETKAWELLK
ncbi:DapH/DapD/GlmU-related protein [Geobacter sp. AOG2]|uniref:acyltransferase n=1 Tax=Geobacter sp. AOG2 TaxID=1566347 RepID=UPI002084FC36|nr:DapH/DapD/GlmU-related protein [Geobacter sp. AOG2]GFE60325.1 putative lipopolysaccharide biosynthesis O-acetyltransferase WbbJ [Geobacter sp. AOG2]